MNKLALHLQQHLSGEVLADRRALEYFSTDGSVLEVMPKIAVYPRNSEDVRRVARFCWQLAERGKFLPITARGKGTDQAGGALGNGLILVFPGHMHKLKGFDKNFNVTVQPGMVYGDLHRTLISHGRFLPPYPSSIEFCTIGGAIANNACGEKTLKYGCTKNFVKSLQVVLANGQEITVAKLNRRQLNRKKGQTDFEGDIYRKLDGLVLDNKELISQAKPNVSKNAAGYALWDIRGKDGSFDLTKLICGSQGTLGIVTEATMSTELFNANADLLVASFDDLEKVGQAVLELRKLNPSAIELVDKHLLEFLKETKPASLVGFDQDNLPAVVLLIEFDDAKRRVRNRQAKKAHKLLANYAYERRIIPNHAEQDQDWMMRHSVAAVIWQNRGTKKALPIIEDGVVPVEKLPQFLQKAYDLFKKHHLEIAVWGHAGDGNFHMQPFLDLGSTGDRQKVFKIMDEFYAMVMQLGGSTSAEHNDGRLRGPYLKQLYGSQVYELFRQVKQIFDPHNILNPGVKVDVNPEELKGMLRHEYAMRHLYDHMPHSSH